MNAWSNSWIGICYRNKSGDQALGHILFSPVSTAPPNEAKGIGLAAVAVRPDVQSQAIGSQLIRKGLRRCEKLEYDYCVVLVNPRYYRRFGLKNEYGVHEEFMLIRFSKRKLAHGLVRYAPEFALLTV